MKIKNTCEECGVPCAATWRCDPCLASTIRSVLSSQDWLRWRGCAAGDLPGETMEQTLRRELSALEGSK